MRTLIFGTSYVDTVDKNDLARQWLQLHSAVNPECNLLLVDSASPRLDLPEHSRLTVTHFLDNIGHLGKGGRDGWGRAFCYGLQAAIDGGYDCVVHVEGDSLLRTPVLPLCNFMRDQDMGAFVCGINGTKFREFAWVETGMMFLSTRYVRDSQFIERYDWRDGASKRYPNTPEAVIWRMLEQDGQLHNAPLRVMRDDLKVLTIENVGEYDWISHATPTIYSAFTTSAMVPA